MIQQILNQNIWWQDKSPIDSDPKIKEFNAQKIKLRPGVLDEFKLNHFAVYTLRGGGKAPCGYKKHTFCFCKNLK